MKITPNLKSTNKSCFKSAPMIIVAFNLKQHSYTLNNTRIKKKSKHKKKNQRAWQISIICQGNYINMSRWAIYYIIQFDFNTTGGDTFSMLNSTH